MKEEGKRKKKTEDGRRKKKKTGDGRRKESVGKYSQLVLERNFCSIEQTASVYKQHHLPNKSTPNSSQCHSS